jgi:hypothetical protein
VYDGIQVVGGARQLEPWALLQLPYPRGSKQMNLYNLLWPCAAVRGAWMSVPNAQTVQTVAPATQQRVQRGGGKSHRGGGKSSASPKSVAAAALLSVFAVAAALAGSSTDAASANKYGS